MLKAATAFYYRLTLDHGRVVAILLVLLLAGAAWQSQYFRIDASTDSLILENDKDLRYYADIEARYGSQEFLIVTYSPDGELISRRSLENLRALRNDLVALPPVSSVTSILDVPLIDSPRVTLSEIQEHTRTLSDPDTDYELARRELQTSPLYSQLLMSADGETTALLAYLKGDEQARSLYRRRDSLRLKQAEAGLNPAEAAELERVSAAYESANAAAQANKKQTISEVREVLDRYRSEARIFLGGLPMIAVDMISYVRNDIRSFGVGVGLFIIVLLAISFNSVRWVVVPAGICAIVAIVMTGFLATAGWPVTVVSSNFISLILIITLSQVIHLVVQHRELHQLDPSQSQRSLLQQTIRNKFMPSLYTALTTMLSFASMAISDIRPVIDFGVMMTWGCAFAFIFTFLAFPTALGPLAAGTAPTARRDVTASINAGIAAFVDRKAAGISATYGLLVLLGAYGIFQLTVENRFIDYFKPSTEIYQGMVVIDKELGGTTPLDVIIDAPRDFLEEQAADEYALEAASSGGLSATSYWYNAFQLDEVHAIHDYLDQLPETGKVLSLSSSMRMVQMINGDKPLDNFAMAVMYAQLPDSVKTALYDPYLSADGNQLRFAVRVIDSDPNLNRDALLHKIQQDLTKTMGLAPEQVHLTGALVLYNNVLQSLFSSQTKTIVIVFGVISLMFMLLFKSAKMALIGTLPTLIAAMLVLGLLGLLGIPLDIMTITIAAITIGIGVHDTIHYTYRFREEVRTRGYAGAISRSHGSVGRAMVYTTVVISMGFSIMVLSNFMPTIYFGLFTGVAMVFALAANLTLLPILLMKFRPFTVN